MFGKRLMLDSVNSFWGKKPKEFRKIRNLVRRDNQLVHLRESGALPRQVCPLWNALTLVKGLPWGYKGQSWN